MKEAKDNGYNLHLKSFHPCTRIKFTVRTAVHWNNLHRKMVESPSLKVFKMRFDKLLGNLI